MSTTAATPQPETHEPDHGAALQPLLAAETVVLQAPVQAWSSADATMGAARIHGVWVGDTRVVCALAIDVAGSAVENISSALVSSRELRTQALLRGLDERGADPDVRLSVQRRVTPAGTSDELVFTSRLDRPVTTTVSVQLRADATSMEVIKVGMPSAVVEDVHLDDDPSGRSVRWSGAGVDNELTAPGADIEVDGAQVTLRWDVEVPAAGATAVRWRLGSTLEGAVVHGVTTPAPWAGRRAHTSDDRLASWVARALDDLASLRMTTRERPEDVFFAAGAPWFFTLFGRDSLWAARLMLPLDRTTAAGTLRVLAGLQGSATAPETAEQPGKIMHELRREALHIAGEVSLPPLYYGTIDATPLWVCLLHDAWRAGMPEGEVRALMPHLQRALAWMRDHGDSDGDGFLEYVDQTGHGLANQGWKDSADSVQWRDGTFAEGPIALSEVQAYAHEAAVHGAVLLDHFGLEGAPAWREWAARLREQFRAAFWVSDERGSFPAIALDANKRAVNTLTSNIGHLVGTGLLDEAEEAQVAALLVSPQLNSGYGLRTMATTDSGYWPLSYHRGAVWTHDTAIAIAGLLRAGLVLEAQELAAGLLRAAPAFGYRMPELHSGDAAADSPVPVPYPAACRPQAWSAAAVVAVWTALQPSWNS